MKLNFKEYTDPTHLMGFKCYVNNIFVFHVIYEQDGDYYWIESGGLNGGLLPSRYLTKEKPFDDVRLTGVREQIKGREKAMELAQEVWDSYIKLITSEHVIN